MKILRYFFEYIFILILFFLFKLLGYKKASNFGEKIGKFIGPLFRSKKIILNNLRQSKIGNDDKEREKIINSMWGNYGRILAEYIYLKNFKDNSFKKYIEIEGLDNLKEVKENKKKCVFISGHFNNFELMAMQIENNGIDVAAIYRPLNNIFLNKIMENIRVRDICKKQIKKGKTGTRELLNYFKDGSSIALMIDQRVSEGILVNFFGRKCLTTTIPAQLVKKHGCHIIPVYIERKNKFNFKLYFKKPINFNPNENTESITLKLNGILESMILKNPEQWIWSHNRWK